MDDLQEELVIDILSRLPIKTIVQCRCVCKNWLNILSGSYFANLHLSRSTPGLIVHQSTPYETDNLIVGELDDKINHQDTYYDPLTRFNLGLSSKRTALLLTGTVNGLVCLWNFRQVASYICNPITREYVLLPDHKYDINLHTTVTRGFGYVEANNEYKVVSLFLDRDHKSECKVYTLGTGMWRSLGHVPFSFTGVQRGVFVSGNLHWLTNNDQDIPNKLVCTFDLEKESFQRIASPPLVDGEVNDRSLGLLGGCLCICDNTEKSELTLWVMKEYGMKESWTKEIVIRHKPVELLYEKVLPLKVLKDGTILMLCYLRFLVTYHPGNKTLEFSEGSFNAFDAMVYVPSFVRLQSFMLEKAPEAPGTLLLTRRTT